MMGCGKGVGEGVGLVDALRVYFCEPEFCQPELLPDVLACLFHRIPFHIIDVCNKEQVNIQGIQH